LRRDYPRPPTISLEFLAAPSWSADAREADAILTDGFRDGEGNYLTTNVYRGVWVSDVPLDANEGADGDRLLAIDMPETAIADFEWVEDNRAHREWLVPAEVLNR
jgi:hypothetical protein